MNRSLPKIAAVAIAAAAALSACTTVTGGKASVENIARTYTGPEVSTTAPNGTDVMTPGMGITVGAGPNKVTCTAGWFLRATDGTYMVTAGHCARSGVDAPVSFISTYGGDAHEVPLGTVALTTFKEPYNHDVPDLALVRVDTGKESDNLVFAAYPNLHLMISRDAMRDAARLMAEAKNGTVCWYSDVRSVDSAVRGKHCGTVFKGVGNKVLVKPDSADDYTAATSGAPVVWNMDDVRAVPVGVVTDSYKGYIVVDTVGDALEKSGTSIMNR